MHLKYLQEQLKFSQGRCNTKVTKFTKGVLTLGLLIGLGVGGKYGYDYMKNHGYFDEITKTNVPAETVTEIEIFLNDQYNIGFLQANYKEMDINNVSFDTITYLLNNPYEKGSDGKVIKHEFTDSQIYKDYVTSYETNLLNTKACFDAVKLNEYIYSVTNQRLDALENTDNKCISKLPNYIYMIDVKTELVILNDEKYSITYKIKDAENILYNQKYNYTGIEVKQYNGKAILEKTNDNRYIFKSNNVSGARNLYNF